MPMLKVLGYRDREINKITINIYHVLVPIGIALSLLGGYYITMAYFDYSTASFQAQIDAYISGKGLAVFVGGIIAAYTASDILYLNFPDNTFDKVVAGNVIHLLDNPCLAISELDRVCKSGGKIIVPTYINKKSSNRENGFVKMLGRIGADFKQKFTFSSYRSFFMDAGYPDAKYIKVDGFIPCVITVIEKKVKINENQ